MTALGLSSEMVLERAVCRLLVAIALSIFGPIGVAAEALSAKALQNLLAVGPEGTTILFHGAADKLFYSPTLKNSARQSRELGPDFIKKNVQPDTVSEGVFISTLEQGGKVVMISGIAGIAADRDTGNGIVVLLQTFAEDKTSKSFQARDRLYAVMVVEDSGTSFSCKRSHWEKLSAAKAHSQFATGPCEFVVGNSVVPKTGQ